MPALEARFGPEIVRADGGLDRTRDASSRVFADPAGQVKAILHPLIRAESDRRCAAATTLRDQRSRCWLNRAAIARAATASPSSIGDPEVQVARVMARSALPEFEARHHRHPGDACRTTGRGGRCHRKTAGAAGICPAQVDASIMPISPPPWPKLKANCC